ncbi:MAG TPA: hypothetical protein VMF53_02810 [Alphaproteobacteria bacterium]|nr:hypothetical protein [Alphaproteobacteria bacterium]
MHIKHYVLDVGILVALAGTGWVAMPRANEPIAAPSALTVPSRTLPASLDWHRPKGPMSVPGDRVSGNDCIPSGQACVLNGTPCCGTLTCKGNFPNTTCQ